MKAKLWIFYTSLTKEKSGMTNAVSPTLAKLFWSMGFHEKKEKQAGPSLAQTGTETLLVASG